MGNQSSRTSVENIFNTHTGINLDQIVNESCYNNDSSTNRIILGDGNNVGGGIHQNIDSKFSCRMSTTLDAVANSKITNDQFNKVKTEMSQTGVNLFQNQRNNQSASNRINNITDINQLQEIIKNCNSNKSYLNEVIGGDRNTIKGGIHQNIASAVDCIFDTDATLEGGSSTENKTTTTMDSLMKQEGITMLASCGSSIVIIVIAIVILFVMSSSGAGGNKINTTSNSNLSGNMMKTGMEMGMKSLMKMKRR